MSGQLYIGTSGWSYKSWVDSFYPKGVPRSAQLAYYATQFPIVEINRTFYSLPTEQVVTSWQEISPPDFLFAVKGSRFITHVKKLQDLGDALDRFFDRIRKLQKGRVILWQLPPMLLFSPDRLKSFLRQLPANRKHAVEFRHPSWLVPETFRILKEHHAAHVSVSSLGMPMNLTRTTNWSYIRFHGLEHGAAHDYTRHELEPWSEHIRTELRNGHTVYAFFNNDANVRAPANAKMLRDMIQGPCKLQRLT